MYKCMTHVQAVCTLSLLDYACKGSSVSLHLLNLGSQALVVFLEAPPLMGQILREEINLKKHYASSFTHIC